MATDSTLTLTLARDADVRALVDLTLETVRFSNAYEYGLAGRVRLCELYTAGRLGPAAARRQITLARDVSGLAGFVWARRRTEHGRGTRTIEGLFVHPEVQGRGIGAMLLEAGLASAGPAEMRATVVSSLTAEGFYARAGFEALRDVERDYGLAVLMSRA